MPDKMWMVRAGISAYLANEFEERKCVAIGWVQIGDLTKIETRKELEKLYAQAYPEHSKGKKAMSVGQLARFRFEIEKNDFVLTYNAERRIYLVGKITSDYVYKQNHVNDYSHIRMVEWVGEVSRDKLSTTTKNTIGAIMTLFLLNDDARQEFQRLLKGEQRKVEDESEELDAVKLEVMDRAREFIKDRVLKLDWAEMQDLVAGVLRGMGYKTRVSAKGPDRGVDIMASPDGLGLEQPRIRVEVKHRQDFVGSHELRSFIGGLRTNDRGLYVSTGGFSKDARYEAERSTIPISLLNIDDLTELLIENYDNLDNDTKALIPLVKLYWPA